MEDSEADKNGTKQNGRDEADLFEDCHKVLENTPISDVKVTTFLITANVSTVMSGTVDVKHGELKKGGGKGKKSYR